MHSARNPFGELLVDPDRLSREERWDCLRRLAGRLLGGRTLEEQWLGRKLQDRLHEGGDLEDCLGLRPPRGSRKTPQRATQEARVRSLLKQLSAAMGGDAKAARALRGDVAVSKAAAPLVEELRRLDAPTSRSGIARACGARHSR